MRLPRASLRKNQGVVDGTSATAGSRIDPNINAYIEQRYGRTLEQLLAPIGDNEVGDSVRHNGVYREVKEARRADDPTLPQGIWTYELKAADWDQVESTVLETLAERSKDLQLGVWLMESSIHRYGFSGVAPGALLIRGLCEFYWESMHPQMEDGDIEFRTNPINWINDKLSLQLRLLPITSAALDGPDLCWDDWDNAQRLEHIRHQQKLVTETEGGTTDSFKHRLAATPADHLVGLAEQLEDGQQAVQDLSDCLDQKCGDDSPSLRELLALLSSIASMVGDELQRRGVRLAASDKDDAESEEDGVSGAAGADGGSSGSSGGGGLRGRADAFAQLREAAEYLMRDDPHSPVPYMVYTACEWGEKSAPLLYDELFLRKGGQLNIFELMGLDVNVEQGE